MHLNTPSDWLKPGIGQKDKDNGVLIYVAQAERSPHCRNAGVEVFNGCIVQAHH
ncbi:MAG: TPM domain-containing protein [Haliscomenobacter sp.]|nr:TPM domain-containing protein [Haliscomenobacter sp.]MBK9488295.1 TPM domain-containing protein [Haliscomenobacter sp.]